MHLSNAISLKSLFTLICTILTVLLICQELYTFSIVKPTTTSNEERGLQTTDLPDVVFCLEPAFDLETLNQFGYRVDSYFQGSPSGEWGDFVCWNGQGMEKSSQDILNEVLVFDDNILGQLVKKAKYADQQNELKPEMMFRELAYPFGRCLIVSPPNETSTRSIHPNILYLSLGLLKKGTRLKIFFMEKSSSLQLYPNEMEMTGEKLDLKLWRDPPEKVTYKVKISQNQHVQGDPLFNCAVYTIDDSYNDCVQNELLEFFDKEIGCQPPLLDREPSLMCNRKFNVSSTKAHKINKYFMQLYIHNVKFKCRTPCSSNKFTTQLVHTTKSGKKITYWSSCLTRSLTFPN